MSDKNNPNTNSNAGRLSKWGILALGIGGCIGSGVISLLGYGSHALLAGCPLLGLNLLHIFLFDL